MGVKMSIDKHVSNLDELLDMSAQYFQKVKFESKISPDITQHLKIWRFSEDSSKFDSVKTTPVPLAQLQQSNFTFSQKESYLILFVYKAGSEAQQESVNFTKSLWKLVQSAENLSPRGLKNTFATNETSENLLQQHAVDSFLLNRGAEQAASNSQSPQSDQQFKYMLSVWNGKEARSTVKASAVSKNYELNGLLAKAKDAVLKVLFSGGVIRGKKLQRGSVYIFGDVIDKNGDAVHEPEVDELLKAYESVHLLKQLFPPQDDIQKQMLQQARFQRFSQVFESKSSKYSSLDNYWSSFAQPVDEPMQVDQQAQPVLNKPQMSKLGGSAQGGGFQMNKLNLGKVKTTVQEAEEQKTRGNGLPPTMKLGFGADQIAAANAIKNQEMQQEQQQKKVPNFQLGQPPAMQPSKRIPQLKLGDVSSTPDPMLSSESAGKPKMGFGLDLTKAKTIQQEHLAKTEMKNAHAKQTAEQAQFNAGQQQKVVNEVNHNNQNSHRIESGSNDESPYEGTQSSQGQGDSNRNSMRENVPLTGLAALVAMNNANGGSTSQRFDQLQIAPEELNDEDFDFKGTSRKEYENAFYKRVCSEVIDGFLFLGSDLMAKDEENFQKNGITHVINCCADYSEDYFIDKGVIYKSYHLKDHVREDIACVFYDAIKFMEEARAQGGKLYVHCVQGISRSATLCLAYMIKTEGISYNDGLMRLKARRQCVNPNMTFIAQLIWFQKRLYDTNFDALPVNPRCFLVCSHQTEDPSRVVAKFVMENMFKGNTAKTLDPRGFFIVVTAAKIYLWIGGQVPNVNMQAYTEAAWHHIGLLQKHERASKDVAVIKQGEEPQDFWKVFNSNAGHGKPSIAYNYVAEWSHLFIDLEKAKQIVKGFTVVKQMDQYKEIIDQEKLLKVKLFQYPEWNQPSAIFDFDDLENDETLIVLCVRQEPGNEHREKHTAYVWRGDTFKPESSLDEQKFIQESMKVYWGEVDLQQLQIQIVHERAHEESEEFMYFFD